MEKKPSQNHLKAWEIFITQHAKILRNIEMDLESIEDCLPLHQYDILLVLNRAPKKKLRLSEIAEKIVTSRSNLTRSVDKLEKMSLVLKEKAQEDGRGQYAVLTNEGFVMLKKSWVHYRAAIQKYFARYLSKEEAHVLQKLIAKVLPKLPSPVAHRP